MEPDLEEEDSLKRAHYHRDRRADSLGVEDYRKEVAFHKEKEAYYLKEKGQPEKKDQMMKIVKTRIIRVG